MRITQPQLINNLIGNLERNFERMSRTQEKLSTGKKFSKPSENPLEMAASLAIKVDKAELKQYQKNLLLGRAWLDAGSRGMEQYQQLLQEAYEITMSAANDTNAQGQRGAYAKQIRAIRDQISEIANLSLGGRKLYSGSKTLTEPFDDLYNYQGAANQVAWEVTRGESMDMALSGDLIFRVDETNPYDATNSIFITLSDLADTMEDPATNLTQIAGYMDTLKATEQLAEKYITEFSSRMERIDLLDGRQRDEELYLEKTLADKEGLDIARAFAELKISENVYEASLSAAARIGRLSILDFLR